LLLLLLLLLVVVVVVVVMGWFSVSIDRGVILGDWALTEFCLGDSIPALGDGGGKDPPPAPLGIGEVPP